MVANLSHGEKKRFLPNLGHGSIQNEINNIQLPVVRGHVSSISWLPIEVGDTGHSGDAGHSWHIGDSVDNGHFGHYVPSDT